MKYFFYAIASVLFFINQNFYEEIIFELYLYLNIIETIPYIDMEVMYILTVFHLIILSNLKIIENFWDIIDKKLSRWY